MFKNKSAKFLVMILFCMFIASCSSSSNSASSQPTITTQAGIVAGVTRNGVNEYRGIPYGVSQRWALPTAAPSWQGTFDASSFGPACPQQARFELTEGSTNENCLSINVSMPTDIKPGEVLPVLFWIHGGAFIGGSSNLYRLDKLAGDGRLVVVSMNYRLGALGFMPTSFTTGNYNGNYGLEDQRLAMKWVQKNIAAFGGDTNNITIAGESSGAGSVCMHLSSPAQVKGLFNKAIVQSAGCMQQLPTVTEALAMDKASATIQEALCPASSHPTSASVSQCMLEKSVDEILISQGNYTAAHSGDITPFSPVTGDPTSNPPLANATVPSSFKYAASKKKLVAVPMIMGGTKDELRLYVGYFWQSWYTKAPNVQPINESTINSVWLPNFYPGSPAGSSRTYASTIYDAYADLHSLDPDVVAKTFGSVLSDYNPGIGINNCLYLETSNVLLNYAIRNATKLPIYQFEFADAAAPVCKVGIAEPCPTFEMGAVHSSELNYFFPNLSNTHKIDGPDLVPASQALADQMVAYWAQFAYSGNPNSNGLPSWPLYGGADSASVMLLSPGNVGAVNSDKQHQCTSFWNGLYNLRNQPPFP